jgi:hypothetical protein
VSPNSLQPSCYHAWLRTVATECFTGLRHALRCQVEAGYDFEENKYLDIEGISFSMQVFARTSLHSGSSPSIPKYMCNWAYRLLWTERSSATLDFRRFHERFSSLFKNRQARCVGIEQCDGRSPENCKRFKGATIEDQSAHDVQCPGQHKCNRLYWDEASYRAVKGARAVCIKFTDDRVLMYCTASRSTLAISHV